MDSSVSPENPETDRDDLPVDIGTLEIDGVRPAVGDIVKLKVGGTISKIVNEVAWVTPETVNDAPLPAETPDATDDELMESAQAHDSAMMGATF